MTSAVRYEWFVRRRSLDWFEREGTLLKSSTRWHGLCWKVVHFSHALYLPRPTFIERHHPTRGAVRLHSLTALPRVQNPDFCCWTSELSRYAHGLINSRTNNHTQRAQMENLKRPGVHESVPGLGRRESRVLRCDFGFPLVHCLGVDVVGVHT